MFLPNWSYDGGDPGLRLFTLANPLLPALHKPDVLEIGSCDTDWLQMALKCHPTLSGYGVDWRGKGVVNVDTSRPYGSAVIRQGDIMTVEMPFKKDAVISLSAIEHIGLGRYENDPRDPYGDIKTIQRVREWLRPKGFCYFDVPYTPEGYQVFDTNKCRCYDDRALAERFGPHQVLGYTNLSVTGWIDKPTKNNHAVGGRPFYYVALLITKD